MGDNSSKNPAIIEEFLKDIETLFAGIPVKVGKTTFNIEPFKIEDFKQVYAFVRVIKAEFAILGMRPEAVFDPGNFPLLANLIVLHGQPLVSLATGIPVEKITNIPLIVTTQLALAIIEVNIRAQVELEKNLIESLKDTMLTFNQMASQLARNLPKLSEASLEEHPSEK